MLNFWSNVEWMTDIIGVKIKIIGVFIVLLTTKGRHIVIDIFIFFQLIKSLLNDFVKDSLCLLVCWIVIINIVLLKLSLHHALIIWFPHSLKFIRQFNYHLDYSRKILSLVRYCKWEYRGQTQKYTLDFKLVLHFYWVSQDLFENLWKHSIHYIYWKTWIIPQANWYNLWFHLFMKLKLWCLVQRWDQLILYDLRQEFIDQISKTY